MWMEVDGIPVWVQRKPIKNIHLRVKPPDGRVEASVPLRVSDRAAADFIRAHLDWIRRSREKLARRGPLPERRYVSGETLSVWGEAYPLQVEYSGRGNSLVLRDGRAVLTVRQASTAKQRHAYVKEWYRTLLKAEISQRLPVWEARTGLYCSGWQTRDMTTRWGTCNTGTGKLWFSLRLAERPVRCLDYLLLHELAHLRVRDHGPAFTALLDRHMPQWRELRRELNEGAAEYAPPRD